MSKKFPPVGETWKAHARRVREGWFELYAPPDRSGIDIGPDRDPLNHTFRRWTYEKDGDATQMAGVPDEVFHTVYASHVLEHLHDPVTGLRNWYRILKPGGCLVALVPDRDRYEKRTELPSRWNPDHKFYWLADRDEAPVTLSFRRILKEAIPHGELVSFAELADGFDYRGPDEHSFGEYSLEAIIRKPIPA